MSSLAIYIPVTKEASFDPIILWALTCTTAGGGGLCNIIAIDAISTLLPTARPCAQQNSADTMISLAKQLNNADMITLATIFVQQPRHNPTSGAVPYCQSAPSNNELNGLYPCRFSSAMEATEIWDGGAGAIPFGQTNPPSPPGSCPAHPSGPVPDGVQLLSVMQHQSPPEIDSKGRSSELHPMDGKTHKIEPTASSLPPVTDAIDLSSTLASLMLTALADGYIWLCTTLIICLVIHNGFKTQHLKIIHEARRSRMPKIMNESTVGHLQDSVDDTRGEETGAQRPKTKQGTGGQRTKTKRGKGKQPENANRHGPQEPRGSNQTHQ